MRHLVLLIGVLAFILFGQGRANTEGLDLENRALIADQIAKYAQLWDRKDADGFAALFTEDAVLEWHFKNTDKQLQTLVGRENILKYARKAHAGRLAGRQSRHHFSGLIFESVAGTSALTEHMYMVTHVTPSEPPTVRSTGIYQIEWRKTDNGWLMSHRKLFVDRLPGANPSLSDQRDLLGATTGE